MCLGGPFCSNSGLCVQQVCSVVWWCLKWWSGLFHVGCVSETVESCNRCCHQPGCHLNSKRHNVVAGSDSAKAHTALPADADIDHFEVGSFAPRCFRRMHLLQYRPLQQQAARHQPGAAGRSWRSICVLAAVRRPHGSLLPVPSRSRWQHQQQIGDLAVVARGAKDELFAELEATQNVRFFCFKS